MNTMGRRIGLGVVVLGLAVAGAVGRTEAGIVLESAPLGTTGVLGGTIIDSDQFLGARFTLTETTRIDHVGGHLSRSHGSVFAAIIELSGPGAVPDFAPSAIESEALASTTFTPPPSSADFMTVLDATLGPGTYALVFGSGYLGAVGLGLMPQNDTDTAQASYFHSSFEGSWIDGGFNMARFVVTGEPVTTSAVPEPSTLAGALLGVGLCGGGWWLRRRKHQAA